MSDFQTAINRIFDQVYVVSLPESRDRRDHIRQHFSEIGLTRYGFFDARNAEAPDVCEAFRSGQVASYPPCFRCGALRCGREDCNNVLTPPQVANFCTYRALWIAIAAQPQRALVIEDDVVFEPGAAQTLERLAEAIAAGKVEFVAEVPRLLRLGWARGEDHGKERGGVPAFRLSGDMRMSNPCHGLTSAYARALLDRFERFRTTSDVYMHQKAPRLGEAVTVFPPLASEQSWSTGAVTSLIHPREIRTTFLEAQGRLDEARTHAQQVRDYVKHIHHRPLLILGHPGAGLERTHARLREGGLDVGYQQDGQDGLCSWSLAAEAEYPAADRVARRRRHLHWSHLIQSVGDPRTAVPRICADLRRFPAAHAFRRLLILQQTGVDIDACDTDVERAVLSLTLWSGIVAELKPDLVLRVEDGLAPLRDFLSDKATDELRPLRLPEPADAENPETPPAPCTAADWAALPADTKARLAAYCDRYGYRMPGAAAKAAPKTATKAGQPKISVIIPIYGTEAHVEKCIRSVMAQTLREIEILCVDDCSPDNSAAIVERLAAEDGRVRLIRHKRNLGLGGARNTGIEAARAPYVAGVDSDDYILPEMMEKLWEGTGGGAADIVICGANPVNTAGVSVAPTISPEPGRYVNTDNQVNIFEQFNPAFWNKIWRTGLFMDTGIRFPEHAYYEDLATTPRLLRHARDIRVIPGAYYQYVIRDGSITNSTSPKHVIDYFRTYDMLDRFLKQEQLEDRYRAEFTKKIGGSLSYHAWGIMKSNLGDAQKTEYLRYMLFLKLGFLAYNDTLLGLDAKALQRLLLNATGTDDLPRPE